MTAAHGPCAQGAVDSDGQAIDGAFYRTFWGLQAAFQAPYAAMEPSRWASVIGDVRKVLAEFGKQVRRPCRSQGPDNSLYARGSQLQHVHSGLS